MVFGGCQAYNTAAPKALLAVTTSPAGPNLALGYHDGWMARVLNRSPDRLVSLNHLSSERMAHRLPQPPEAILAVAAAILVFGRGQVWRVGLAGDGVCVDCIGSCPAAVRQSVVIPRTEAPAGPLVALLAGGHYVDGQLRAADLFLGKLRGDCIQFHQTAYRAAWNPWLIRAGRLRKRPILFVGAVMPVHFDPQPHRRPQLFEVISDDPPRLRPLWLGTSLSRPFVDATFVDCDGDGEDELAAVELAASGEFLVQLYKWAGSGFEGWAATAQCYSQPPEIAAVRLRSARPQEALLIKSNNSLIAYDAAPSGTDYGEDQLVPAGHVQVETSAPWVVIAADADNPGYIVCLRAEGDLYVQELP